MQRKIIKWDNCFSCTFLAFTFFAFTLLALAISFFVSIPNINALQTLQQNNAFALEITSNKYTATTPAEIADPWQLESGGHDKTTPKPHGVQKFLCQGKAQNYGKPLDSVSNPPNHPFDVLRFEARSQFAIAVVAKRTTVC